MHQTIAGKSVYVVDFDTMPKLPITGLTESEYAYEIAKDIADGRTVQFAKANAYSKTGKCANALTHAIETGVITEPGKYGIYLVPGTDNYEIYTIIE